MVNIANTTGLLDEGRNVPPLGVHARCIMPNLCANFHSWLETPGGNFTPRFAVENDSIKHNGNRVL